MLKPLLLVFGLLFSAPAFCQDLASVCNKLNELNTAILNGSVKKLKAALQFRQLIGQLKNTYKAESHPNWVFPLKGYQFSAIGGSHGNGYSDKGYHYLDGNKHSAHPAHDIFINDRNQDDLDDRTLRSVDVLAVDDGIVIACSNEWEPGSKLRGGKYTWIYHADGLLTYYAHNQAIFVKPGDCVSQGQKIAEVGRTGFNAYQKRSPTHLHFSAFHLINGLPVPFNCYTNLSNAKKS
jgi:peptidoglycan LD-endopeptidase LytH